MRAGRLRTKVRVQSPTNTLDDYGESTRTWDTLRYAMAHVRALNTNENRLGPSLDARAYYEVYLRYCDAKKPDGTIINHADRIVIDHDGRVLNIASVVDIEQRRTELRVMCIEDVS